MEIDDVTKATAYQSMQLDKEISKSLDEYKVLRCGNSSPIEDELKRHKDAFCVATGTFEEKKHIHRD